jgi:predicted O-methyltransferase YrrM
VSRFFQAKTYFTYWLDAINEHSLHSPFLYDLYTTVLKPTPSVNVEIEKLRTSLLKTTREIIVEDLGAGSTHLSKNTRKISAIAATSSSTIRFSAMYARLAQYCHAGTIIELGTSFGLNTAYLAQKRDATVYTFEGAPCIAEIAESTFEFLQMRNVELIKGNIDTTLPALLSRLDKIDFAFLDANHQYEPTKRYFELLVSKLHHQSLMIIDDIHGNAGMHAAWNELCKHPLVYTSIDLYRCGILFFDPSLNKQHVVLQVAVLD